MKSCRCFFVSDLHGRPGRYRKLAAVAHEERPHVVLLGGDLLPFERHWSGGDFVSEVMVPTFAGLADRLGDEAPRVLLIMGNDDPRYREADLVGGQDRGLWDYLHGRSLTLGEFEFFGYACVPPTPFMLKDWDRYDVSRYVEPGSVSPEEGHRTVPMSADDARFRTIQADLERLTEGRDLGRAVFLFHSPPYQTALDRAGVDGMSVDHAPLDLHVGSVAIARFIEERQPLLTLHGHIHESTRLTGSWRERIGKTHAFNGAHDGPELALVRFDLADLDGATRELI